MTYRCDTPFYIDTRFNYFCEGCKQEELEIETERFNVNGEVFVTTHTLTCKNYDHCKKLVHRLRYESDYLKGEE